jgi:hypothetical protein
MLAVMGEAVAEAQPLRQTIRCLSPGLHITAHNKASHAGPASQICLDNDVFPADLSTVFHLAPIAVPPTLHSTDHKQLLD